MAAAAGLLALAAGSALAQDDDGRGWWGMMHGTPCFDMTGPGMMAQGWGPGGMQGPSGMGWGPGGWSPGGWGPQGWGGPMMSNGMIAPGMGPQGWGRLSVLPRALSVDDVRSIMGFRVAWMMNPNLKVGRVEEQDGGIIVVEIVTQDDSLVSRFAVSALTGDIRPMP
ncbi:MAG: hypothetical protein R3F55_02490 [Alphaproteobacteria bacterium]